MFLFFCKIFSQKDGVIELKDGKVSGMKAGTAIIKATVADKTAYWEVLVF